MRILTVELPGSIQTALGKYYMSLEQLIWKKLVRWALNINRYTEMVQLFVHQMET